MDQNIGVKFGVSYLKKKIIPFSKDALNILNASLG